MLSRKVYTHTLLRSSSRALSSLRASLGRCSIPEPINEPMLQYAAGSVESVSLRSAIDFALQQCPEIPCVIGGEHIKSGVIASQVMPTNHSHKVCTFHELNLKLAQKAIDSSIQAKPEWESIPFEDRAAIFLKAADLLATKYRAQVCARTMLGQGKNVWQAEIDAAAETADFWRFNVKYAESIYETQPQITQAPGTWNRMEHRPLEGFVVAISPFNFTAIGANLASAPVLMGNTCVWKPSNDAILSNYLIYEVLEEAGLPAGVINFLPGDGALLGELAFSNMNFAGLHFTGSTKTFNTIWKDIANNIGKYRTYPRIVGETGGKNFHVVHASADMDTVVHQTIRGAFEYQGQKCSATSRAYLPKSAWPYLREQLELHHSSIKVGCVTDFTNFMGAVINQASFNKISAAIDHARQSNACEIIAGGSYDDSKGFFIEPTIIVTNDPHYKTMQEELFGPVLTIYVYDDDDFESTLQLCNETSAFGLTGAVFARDRLAIDLAHCKLRHAAGNFYVNDKSTGAVVGQQAFGGARGSGTNDKSGSAANLNRWISSRTIKETFVPLPHFSYPHMKL